MLSEFFRHLRYFTPRLLGFGTVLGGLFGALSYPFFGAFIGAPWGFMAGLLVAFLLSIFIPIYERRFPQDDETNSQISLSLAAGLVTTIVMAIPLLILFAPIAGLTAAYLVDEYSESSEYTGEKRKSDSQDLYQRRKGVFSKVASLSLDYGKWVVFLGTIVSLLLVVLGFAGNLLILGMGDLFALALMALTALAYGFILSMPIAAINGLFVNMMNRLYFKDMPKAQYKPQIIVMLSLLTLWTSAVVTFGIGAPFAAVAAGFAAAKYADWYFEGEEKSKRQARLEDGLEDEGEALDNDDEMEEMQAGN